MLIKDLGNVKPQIISPVINIGKANFESKIFIESCEDLVTMLGVEDSNWHEARKKAADIQNAFDMECLNLGAHALDFCKKTGVTPVIVIGRSYTIYNNVLNSNVPAILREQGAIAIPVDCYPIDDDTPVFPKGYWGYGQKNIRAAHQIRRREGIYSIYTSNYSCGPDSFNVHFYSYIMEGKPFSIIETDGHSGDAGTKTRIEAFLYCVHEDLTQKEADKTNPKNFLALQKRTDTLDDIFNNNATVLVPRMGPGAQTLSAALRGLGLKAESLPMPDQEALALGRRYTSGKECFPMVITLGSLLQRLEKETDPDKKFSFFMPTSNGPCRFGSYNVLDQIVLERLGYKDKVSIWAPVDDNYFATVPSGFAAIAYTSLASSDILLEALYHCRPVEKTKGAATKVWSYYLKELEDLLENYVRNSSLSNAQVLTNVLSGHLFGITDLLKRAGKAFLEVIEDKEMPQVLVAGEMYVRCDPFSNNFVIDELEKRKIRCKFAAFNEWLEYCDYQDGIGTSFSDYLSSYIQASIQHQLYAVMADIFKWPRRTTIQDSIGVGKNYIREELSGEAILTIGGPIHEWRNGHIDGTVSVGPLECMPNKIAENQFFHIAENEGLHSLTLHLNGDPLDPEILDNFAYEIHARFKRRKNGLLSAPAPLRPRPPIWKPRSRVNKRDI
jgi:predicted nucleotide-binding protein (sugar kinase/HSP70/actin superfamily)